MTSINQVGKQAHRNLFQPVYDSEPIWTLQSVAETKHITIANFWKKLERY